jgi:glyceraldehyde-3-phosphate dehydrogenase (NADP+)
MAGADLDLAMREVVTGALSFNGQRCTGLKLTFVHASIVDAFLEKLSHAVNGLPFGLPWDKGVKLTPMPEFHKAGAMQAFVDDAVTFPPCCIPFFLAWKSNTKEQFGPVVPVCAYHDEQQFLDYVTQSNYGQQVSLFGRDPDKLFKLIDPPANQVCRINLNAQCQRGPDKLPFAGRKDSAEATLSMSDALRCFSIRSLVAAESNLESREIIQEIVTRRHSNFLRTDVIL